MTDESNVRATRLLPVPTDKFAVQNPLSVIPVLMLNYLLTQYSYEIMTALLSPLLALPTEILDEILSYVIYCPNHAGTSVYPRESYKALFRPQILHVSQRLRSCGFEYIAREVFWVYISCEYGFIKRRYRDYGLTRLQIPEVWKECLPLQLSFLKVSSFPEAQYTKESEIPDIVIPFNFNALASVWGHWIDSEWPFQNVVFQDFTLSERHARMYREQIKPLFRLLSRSEMVENTREVRFSSKRPYEDWSAGAWAVALLDIVKELDSNGYKLEATFLCLTYSFYSACNTRKCPEIGELGRWTNPNGPLLGQEDWLTNAANLRRMRLIRTIHYLEYRACLGWTAARKEYCDPKCVGEATLPFVMSTAMLDLSWPLTRNQQYRWLKLHFNTFGLPDFELAQVAHASTLIYLTLLNDSDKDYDKIHYERSDLSVSVIYKAGTAWYLDPLNETYSSLLRSIMECTSDQMLRNLRTFIVNELSFRNTHDGSSRLHPWKSWHYGAISNIPDIAMDRARQLSAITEVDYDARPDLGYEKWADILERFINPSSENPCCRYCDEFQLNIHMLPECPRDQYAEEVADWSSSSWREFVKEPEIRARYDNVAATQL